MTGRMIDELDGKVVRTQDRRYLQALAARKGRRQGGGMNRSMSLGASADKGKRASSYQGYQRASPSNGAAIGGSSDFNNGTGAIKK